MDLDYVQIGKRLKQVRGSLTQAAFGAQFGYGYGYIKSCEHGKKPSLEYLHKVAQYYKLSMDWIIYGIDPIEATNDDIVPLTNNDLNEMIKTLTTLMNNSDPDVRGWAKIQFKNAFKDL